MLTYRPRRASKRWLEMAPEYVLSVHDSGPATCDRYTVCFGGSQWAPSMGRTVSYLGMSAEPFHPQGFAQHGEMNAHDRTERKIRWLDLPADCRRAVIQSATMEATARAYPQDNGKWKAQFRASWTCNWSDVVNDAGEPIFYDRESYALEAAKFNDAAWRLAGPPRV